MSNAALNSIKVVRPAYHGNIFVGNHCHIVLKNFKVLTRVLSNGNDEANFNGIFSIFRDIMELISSNRFLDEAEINRIDDLLSTL